jgi:NADH-quinone oxidoreductase subunit L
MFQLLWLVAAIPFASAALLALFGSRLPRKVVAIAGAGSIGFAAALTLLIGVEFIASCASHASGRHVCWLSDSSLLR